MGEVRNTPAHLGFFVSSIRQREDGVVVRLGNGVSVSEASLTGAIGISERRQHVRGVLAHPSQERGTEVEADVVVRSYALADITVLPQDGRTDVRPVALCGDSVVPIRERRRRWLWQNLS